MTRSQQTTRNISNALRSIDNSLVPPDCATEVYYDKIGRLWYAQFLDTKGNQIGWLGCGESPLWAVQDLMKLNKPAANNFPQLKESDYHDRSYS